MPKNFQKCKESFTCAHCGHFVDGDGYTNHCPQCLWSRHVDINPGDRAEICKGMMEPIAISGTKDLKVLHQCVECGLKKTNKIAADDNYESVLDVIKTGGQKIR